MKTTNKILLIAFLIIILASLALMVYVRLQLDEDMFRSVDGSGQVMEQERSLGGFHGVHLRGELSVYLYPDTIHFIRVKADDNMHEFIVTEVKDGIVSLIMERVPKSYAKLEVHIGAPSFDDVKASSGGKMFSEGPLVSSFLSHVVQTGAQSKLHLQVDELELKVQAGAKAALEGRAETVSMISQAGAMVYANDLVIGNCDLQARGGSINHLHILGSLTGRARQGAIIQLTGNPDQSGFNAQQNVTIEIR